MAHDSELPGGGADPSEARTPAGGIEGRLYSQSLDALQSLLQWRQLGEQHLLVLLSRKDLPRDIISQIAHNRDWMSSYPVKLAVLKHPRTPRHVALPLLKFVYLFDLLALALTPGAAPELKRLAEDGILAQGEALALGQRISLARRGSLRLVASLLGDSDRRVIEAALSNPVLIEESVAAAVIGKEASAELIEAVLNHPRWSCRHSVKLALVRTQHLSLARVMGILAELSTPELIDISSDRRVAGSIRGYAAKTVQSRFTRTAKREL